MELVFHKENGLYITEFEVTSDFNVHLERSKGGKVSFYQKTTDGNYDHIEKLSKNIDKVFDYDFQALVYPKIIKITSECEFDVASLTTDGEVTEIKSQSKEVEITANGVTEIAPDAGFGYLSGVKVNVNVPQSGGSGGGESGGGKETIRYCNVLSIFGIEILSHTAAIVKCAVDGTTKFYPNVADGAMTNYDILAAGIIISDSYESLKPTGMGFEEAYANMVNDGLLQTITEEEFYTI